MADLIATSGNRRAQARSSRLLSYLLLFLISYGSSTEIFHHHGFASEKSHATSANLVSDNGLNHSSTKTPLERDCLVCQFQRGLSSAAIFAPLLVVAPVNARLAVSSKPISQDSISTTASRGRAPPVTL
jgi:hypothetical protein